MTAISQTISSPRPLKINDRHPRRLRADEEGELFPPVGTKTGVVGTQVGTFFLRENSSVYKGLDRLSFKKYTNVPTVPTIHIIFLGPGEFSPPFLPLSQKRDTQKLTWLVYARGVRNWWEHFSSPLKYALLQCFCRRNCSWRWEHWGEHFLFLRLQAPFLCSHHLRKACAKAF